MTARLSHLRPVLGPLAVILAAAVAVPPLASSARHYAAVQAVQFVVFAAVAPALLVLGWQSWFPRSGSAGSAPPRRAGRPGIRAAASLLPCLVIMIAWRLPVARAALARDPALTVLELATLIGAGVALWRELAGLPARESLPRPLRAVMAAIAMWTLWVMAYVTGMSAGGATPVAAGVVRSIAQTQLAAGVLWAVPAACYVPVVFVMAMSWFGERENPDTEARKIISAAAFPDLGSSLRAPRVCLVVGG